MKRNNRGFTLIEVIVVAAIIAILAGILVPMIFSQIDESKIARATGDVKSIANSIMIFRKDNSKWPGFSAGTFPCSTPASGGDATVISLLQSVGTIPRLDGANWDTSSSKDISILLANLPLDSGNSCYPAAAAPTSPGWKGPYLPSNSTDPWGNAYLVNSKDFEVSGNGMWAISAGPDGIVQTGANDATLLGDDIGVKLK